MKMSIGAKIGAGYALAVAALVIIGIASYLSVQRFITTVAQVERAHRVNEETRDVLVDLINIQNGQRGYVLTGRESFLRPYLSGVSTIDSNVKEALETTKDKEVQTLLGELMPLVTERINFSKRMVNLQKSGAHNAAVQFTRTGEGQQQMDEILKKIKQIEAREQALLKQWSTESNATARATVLTVALGVPVAVVILLLLGYLIVRDISVPLRQITEVANKIASGNLEGTVATTRRHDEIGVLAQAFGRMVHSLQNMAQTATQVAAGNLDVSVKPQSEKDVLGQAIAKMVENLSNLIGQVQRSGIQVNTSATEIAATARQQQATAGEISATTTEISATSKEIAATSKELVTAMKDVAEVAEETTRLADSGQTNLTRMETTMRQIMEAAGSVNARLAVLNEKAGNINTVVTTITKVADQTNLLSLNAAIEAEKAGEYGRGFSVVATEIRRLADQTAMATSDIDQIVREMQSAVSAGVMGMDKFSEEVRRGVNEVQQVGTQLVQIIQQVQALTPNFETVNEGMQSQSLGAQQISEALAQLGEAAQQTVDSLRQSNLAIEQLNEATRGLQDGVSRFTLKA